MKSIILSVKPQEMANILNGEQKIIIKKTAPKETPFKVYLYCTKGKGKRKLLYNPSLPFSNTTISSCIDWGNDIVLNGKVVAEFVCMNVETFNVGSLRCDDIEKLACLTYKEMVNYFYKPIELNGNTQKWGKAIHITDRKVTDLKIYDEPKELDNFTGVCKSSKRCGESKICSSSQKCLYDNLTKPPATWMYVSKYF